MAALRLEWTQASKAHFDALQKRAKDRGAADQFKQAHNEIVAALSDHTNAMELGEVLFKTRKPGGEVRHWVHRFLSLTYVVFRQEQIGWILRYQAVPETWPD